VVFVLLHSPKADKDQITCKTETIFIIGGNW
jgi:hypothetical protein